jgi:hypothetical protein
VDPSRATSAPQDSQPSNTSWIDDTEWHWNDWSNVEFAAGGRFVADNCPATAGGAAGSACTWRARGGEVSIVWGAAGLHVLRPNAARTRLTGARPGPPFCHSARAIC